MREVNDATLTEVYVKQSGDNSNSGNEIGKEKKSLNHAYSQLAYDKPGKIFVVHDEAPLTAEAMLWTSHPITVEGINENGKGNTEVAIDCNVPISSQESVFKCIGTVEFKYLAFHFSTTEHYWDMLIYTSTDSLKISNCQFVRVEATSQRGKTSNVDGNSSVANCLVKVLSGNVFMNSVKCTDDTTYATFHESLFYFYGAKEVSLNEVEINKVNVQSGSAVLVKDESNSSTEVSIEGLHMKEVKAENSHVAGLDITLSSEESTVAIGRTNKCSFKSCMASRGGTSAGAIFIKMENVISHLQLPAANNLDIDSSNKVNSFSRSIFIVAPDIEEFCEKEDSFEFANDYDESAVGWIEVTKRHDKEPVDVYEKYIKVRQEKQKDEAQKKKAGTIVAIVVPIVVVVVVAVVVVVVIIVVRKRKSKSG
ncbi:uncharacterized protein MONOS_1840 [Monocercomonoides exilis]|uniref:uncharacterized protein n=1 Tax=Monocercomonoides exilis TaxID=2049356 RepID=UPI00355ACB56|nr:hypothetical protein MONOS_1840 [Monocercomonoides exilis]|eukprot:MONOS_1840.1-p1 / transcript=MONOS_1840.1 / gene=MONOS_1840 / organism=Monocercomonoides_exilis_PA203 / gene_product=unspecified product / transcript_product=unspecified product / location=Mono_scaffold00035:12855-14123(+) / protein_length=423 / sequence_SO=supercontig / SO=protein_coding / is_pseudo=false